MEIKILKIITTMWPSNFMQTFPNFMINLTNTYALIMI